MSILCSAYSVSILNSCSIRDTHPRISSQLAETVGITVPEAIQCERKVSLIRFSVVYSEPSL